MSSAAIKIENISKCFRIGHQETKPDTLVAALKSALMFPITNYKRLIDLTKFIESESSEDVIWALNDISFEVQHGQVFGIIGGNGAGKSTLLKILSGIMDPTKGQATVCGRMGSLLEVGTGFHPELTGRENLYLSGAILGMKKKEITEKFDEIVDFSGIERFIDTPVKRYSSGMQIRLAFSVAAHLDPEILLIDEVLAVGDIEFQKKCLGKMNDVSKGGRTVLFVSHNMTAVNSLCSKGVVLENGKVLYMNDVDKAIKYYLTNNAKEPSGIVKWENLETAPGDNRIKLKSVKVISCGKITGTPGLGEEIDIEIDYWNLEENERRLVSIHLINESGVTVLTSANFDGASITQDSWFHKKYPKGLFRTKCIIPAFLLQDGIYSIHLFINRWIDMAVILNQKDVISFKVEDSLEMRAEYKGKWTGVVRPKLGWCTEKIDLI